MVNASVFMWKSKKQICIVSFTAFLQTKKGKEVNLQTQEIHILLLII
jgi:hypothetical protein